MSSILEYSADTQTKNNMCILEPGISSVDFSLPPHLHAPPHMNINSVDELPSGGVALVLFKLKVYRPRTQMEQLPPMTSIERMVLTHTRTQHCKQGGVSSSLIFPLMFLDTDHCVINALKK
jgi:hypothetical protein